jgi:hypothetical protein
MQWQTIRDAKAKDKWETKGCAPIEIAVGSGGETRSAGSQVSSQPRNREHHCKHDYRADLLCPRRLASDRQKSRECVLLLRILEALNVPTPDTHYRCSLSISVK